MLVDDARPLVVMVPVQTPLSVLMFCGVFGQVIANDSFSPMAKSPKEDEDVDAEILVAPAVPSVVVDHAEPLNRRITKLDVFADPKTSPAGKLRVAVYAENPLPVGVNVKYLFTHKEELIPDVAMDGCRPEVVEAVTSPEELVVPVIASVTGV